MIIGLVDCNNFYASCERVFNPRLEGRPIGILSNNDGCVIARSNEIKPIVPMGLPAYQIQPNIRKQIILLSSNYELYGDMSRRVFQTLRDHTTALEIYSIDEAFIHLQGFDNTIAHCKKLRSIIKRNTGIPVSIGLSSTRTLAKIANHVAKKDPDYEGVCYLHPADPSLQILLKKLPTSEVWGVGRKIAAKLLGFGIKTAWELRESDLKYIRKNFSVVVERTVLELQGTPCIELEDMDTPKKNIMTSRSFGKATNRYADLQEVIRVHASRGAEKLRKQNSIAHALMVFLSTNRFRKDLLQYNPSLALQLPHPSSDTRIIVATAQIALQRIYREGFLFHKAGVMMLDLTDKDSEQFDLFNAPQSSKEKQRSERLMSTIDKINNKMGRGTLQLGGVRSFAAWQLKRDLLSQRYTTRWDELLTIK